MSPRSRTLARGRRRIAFAATSLLLVAANVLATSAGSADAGPADAPDDAPRVVSVGPRPYFLIDRMRESALKRRLEGCREGPFRPTDFSIGHRGGATLQFPEHTKENYQAGARMGAGMQECDVTFTRDGALVCRHDQCDLHTTTNILRTPLARKCSVPFSPAQFDEQGRRTKAATVLCCTSDLDLSEFKRLDGRMDASNPDARTPEEYARGAPPWRTDLYAGGGTLLSHKESIELLASLGSKFTPELKGPNRRARLQVEAVFGSRAAYAQAMIDEYEAAGIPPDRVFAQSFERRDLEHWIAREPAFGRRAILLEDARRPSELPGLGELKADAAAGIRTVGAPIWALLSVDASGRIVPSPYARSAQTTGLGLVAWTLERSGRIVEDVLPTRGTPRPSFYYQTILEALHDEGDVMTTLDVLAREVGIRGIFSDWSGTVSYYASCMGFD